MIIDSYTLVGFASSLTLLILYDILVGFASIILYHILIGFASTSEARHVAEITNKLANFVIETDTEASIMPTDAGIVHINVKYTSLS